MKVSVKTLVLLCWWTNLVKSRNVALRWELTATTRSRRKSISDRDAVAAVCTSFNNDPRGSEHVDGLPLTKVAQARRIMCEEQPRPCYVIRLGTSTTVEPPIKVDCCCTTRRRPSCVEIIRFTVATPRTTTTAAAAVIIVSLPPSCAVACTTECAPRLSLPNDLSIDMCQRLVRDRRRPRRHERFVCPVHGE